MPPFDAPSIVAALRAETKQRRRPRTYAQRRSVLDDFTHELLSLDAHGANGSEIQRWIAQEKGIRVNRSTVHRWLQRNRPPSLEESLAALAQLTAESQALGLYDSRMYQQQSEPRR